MINHRRHHNNTGLRQIKSGAIITQVESMAKRILSTSGKPMPELKDSKHTNKE